MARGRSVDVPDGPLEVIGSRAVHDSATGLVHYVDVTRRQTRRCGPGEEVTLPRSEVKRLRKLGFLVDPDRAVSDAEAAKLPPPPTAA